MKMNNGILKAACLSVALLGGTAIAMTMATPDMASAKNGNGGGNGNAGGNGKGNAGGNGGAKGNGGGTSFSGGASGSKQAKATSSKQLKTTKRMNAAAATTKAVAHGAAKKVAADGLLPSQKGKWNAAHANQNALDAHVRNQNFNGTIGALAQFQLAAKAAAGETLTEAEQAAVDALVGDVEALVDDQALADVLNADLVDGDPVYSVEGGVVSCSENCDAADLDAAQATVDDELERLQEEAQQAALADLLSTSEARIIDESNKSLSPEDNERLLDELASTLGVTRALAPSDVEETSDLTAQPDVPLTTDG